MLYTCRAGAAGWLCDTAQAAKVWRRMIDDPMASKQRWYCTQCDARYKTGFGVVIELIDKRGPTPQAYYCRATIPDQSIMDAKGMRIEKDYKDAQSPEELYEALPTLAKMQSDQLWEVKAPGVFKLHSGSFDLLPSFDWMQMFNLLPKMKKGESSCV